MALLDSFLNTTCRLQKAQQPTGNIHLQGCRISPDAKEEIKAVTVIMLLLVTHIHTHTFHAVV